MGAIRSLCPQAFLCAVPLHLQWGICASVPDADLNVCLPLNSWAERSMRAPAQGGAAAPRQPGSRGDGGPGAVRVAAAAARVPRLVPGVRQGVAEVAGAHIHAMTQERQLECQDNCAARNVSLACARSNRC